MSTRLQRLADHVAKQYERRGLDRARADRIRELVDDDQVAEPEAAAGEQPAAAAAEDGEASDA